MAVRSAGRGFADSRVPSGPTLQSSRAVWEVWERTPCHAHLLGLLKTQTRRRPKSNGQQVVRCCRLPDLPRWLLGIVCGTCSTRQLPCSAPEFSAVCFATVSQGEALKWRA